MVSPDTTLGSPLSTPPPLRTPLTRLTFWGFFSYLFTSGGLGLGLVYFGLAESC